MWFIGICRSHWCDKEKFFCFFSRRQKTTLRGSLPSSWLTVWTSLAQNPAMLAWGMQWCRTSEAILPSPVHYSQVFCLTVWLKFLMWTSGLRCFSELFFFQGSLSNYWTFSGTNAGDLPLGDLVDITLQILNANFFRSKDICFGWYCLQI